MSLPIGQRFDRPAKCNRCFAPGQEAKAAFMRTHPVSEPVSDDAGADRGAVELGDQDPLAHPLCWQP